MNSKLREQLKDLLFQIAGRDVEPDDRLVEFVARYAEQREREADEKGVGIGMARAKTAITVAWNTGTKDLLGLRKTIDNEIEAWNRINEEAALKETTK